MKQIIFIIVFFQILTACKNENERIATRIVSNKEENMTISRDKGFIAYNKITSSKNSNSLLNQSDALSEGIIQDAQLVIKTNAIKPINLNAVKNLLADIPGNTAVKTNEAIEESISILDCASTHDLATCLN